MSIAARAKFPLMHLGKFFKFEVADKFGSQNAAATRLCEGLGLTQVAMQSKISRIANGNILTRVRGKMEDRAFVIALGMDPHQVFELEWMDRLSALQSDAGVDSNRIDMWNNSNREALDTEGPEEDFVEPFVA